MHTWKRCAWYSFGLFQVIVILIAAAKPANAYVDPGTGILFLQVGGSMLAGVLFALRAKIRKLFRLGSPATEMTDGTSSDSVSETEAEPHA